MGYTNSGGSRGGSVIINKNIDIQSPNDSISINKIENENDVLYELETNIDASNVSVENTDGSIEVVETIDENGNKTYNVSCETYVEEELETKQDVLGLVTEEINGIARSLDKKILDKSFINSNAIDEGHLYNSADEASESLIVESDGYYYPTTGSTMHYLNQNKDLILSRFYKSLGISGNANTPYRWTGAAYKNGMYVISSQSDVNDGEGACKVAYSTNGTQWTIIEASSTHESWRKVEAGSDYFIIWSGNRSSEYLYSTDGISWNLASALQNIYHIGFKYRNGRWVAIGREGVGASNVMIEEFTLINQNPLRSEIVVESTFHANDFEFLNSNYVILGGSQLMIVDAIDKTQISYIQLSNPYNHIYLSNGKLFLLATNKIAVSDDGITWTEKDLYFNPSTNIIYSAGKYLCASASENKIYYSLDLDTWQSMTLPSSSSESWCDMIDSPNGILLTAGALNPYQQGWMTDIAYLLNSSNLVVKNLGLWVEMPVLDTSTNSILAVSDRKFVNVQLDKYLTLINDMLSVTTFDRYTKYANHPAIALSNLSEYQQIWINVANSAIVDGTTNAYSDEACTQSIGVITRHDYNLNNPLEIEVTIDSSIFVYEYINSLYPEGVASMKALIDGLASVEGGSIQPSTIAGQVLKTIFNTQTQQNEILWKDELMSGFEVYNYIEAQQSEMLQSTTNAIAILVRCNPLSDTIISDMSVLITQGATRSFRLAIYDSNRNLLSQTALQSMEVAGFKTVDLLNHVTVNHGESYLLGLLISGSSNGYQLMGRNITLQTNNIRPFVYRSQNNISNDTFPETFNDERITGDTFIPYICANGGY